MAPPGENFDLRDVLEGEQDFQLNEREEAPEKPRCECAVFGLYAPWEDVGLRSYEALRDMQNRGDDSSGIVVSGNEQFVSHIGRGTVEEVYDPDILASLKGELAIGHNRYRTEGGFEITNAQPFILRETAIGPVAFAHNGNLTNAVSMRQELFELGFSLDGTGDSEVAIRTIMRMPADSMEEKISMFMEKAEGSYSAVILMKDRIYTVRDPHGNRPLVLGRIGRNGLVVASETSALDEIGAIFEREVAHGELVEIGPDGIRSVMQKKGESAKCLLEEFYLLNPDSLTFPDGEEPREAAIGRFETGRMLAQIDTIKADVVVAALDSGIDAASGYAHEANLQLVPALRVKKKQRSFMQRNREAQIAANHSKHRTVEYYVKDKIVVIVDDSAVRGNAARKMAKRMRKAGAKEVHIRAASAHIRHPCHYGVAMADRRDLVAHGKTDEEIARALGANSILYLPIEMLRKAMGRTAKTACDSCMTGNYKIPIADYEEDTARLRDETAV